VLRLASLLSRLRRATTIQTQLLEMQAEVLWNDQVARSRGRQKRAIVPRNSSAARQSSYQIKWVSKRPCLICGRQPSDPDHLPLALGRKVSDEFIVSLCGTHHREVHWSSDEAARWKQAGVNPVDFARTAALVTKMIADEIAKISFLDIEASPTSPGFRRFRLVRSLAQCASVSKMPLRLFVGGHHYAGA
jgi:hypothetical protein